MRALPGQASRQPLGPQPVPRADVSADQRRRILRACAELIAKRGYHGTTVELIIRRARVGYGTFYKNFEGKEEAFLALMDAATDLATRRANEALAAKERPWPEQVATVLRTLAELAAQRPADARACMVESLTAGPTFVARYEQAVKRIEPLLRAGRRFNPRQDRLPQTLEETIAGGLVWFFYQRLVVGEIELIEALLPEALEFALTP
jgi:AcrR family transcriptional regulator